MTLDIESAVMISPVVISTLLLLCYLTTCNFPFQSVWQRQHSQLSNIAMLTMTAKQSMHVLSFGVQILVV